MPILGTHIQVCFPFIACIIHCESILAHRLSPALDYLLQYIFIIAVLCSVKKQWK